MLLVASCASNGVPVYDIYDIYHNNRPPAQPATRGYYIVKRGDTLYSIAFRHGWSSTDLARANGIAAPYTIYPGQKIYFNRRVPSVATTKTKTKPTTAKRSMSTKPKTKPPTPRPKVALAKGQPKFKWPGGNSILSHFGEQDSRKGINIGGSKGSPVTAAAKGVVVYRGNGIKGYGNLLIIKHNEQWLSAYAHNASLLVNEGSEVVAGQKIATIGDTGSWRTQLYFEIRKGGKPIDPERLLPKR